MDRLHAFRRRAVGRERLDAFAPVRRESHDVDERLDLWAVSGLADHNAAPRMADQSGRTLLGFQYLDHTHVLPVSRQAKLLGISRSSGYYLPRAVSDADLTLMHRIDELPLEHPFAGALMLVRILRRESFVVGRKHVSTLMKRMSVDALYRKRNTSRKHPAHKIWPYLLRHRKIERSNEVWRSTRRTFRWRGASSI
jgi:hypothetical protein